MDPSSVTDWLRQLGKGDADAAARLWQHYQGALERLAKNRMGTAPHPVANEEDLAQSVFLALWSGAQTGKWNGVKDRSELWWVLLEITRRKALQYHAYQKVAKRSGTVVSLTPTTDMCGDSTIDLPEPADLRELLPDAAAILNEEHDRLMLLLRDDQLRTVAALKLQGYTQEEIAQQLHVNSRTILRKLKLIREQWSSELTP